MPLQPNETYIPWPMETSVTPRAMHYIAQAILFFLTESTEAGAFPAGVETELMNCANMMRNYLEKKAERSMQRAAPARVQPSDDDLLA